MKNRWLWMIVGCAVLAAATCVLHACGGSGGTPAPTTFTVTLKGATS